MKHRQRFVALTLICAQLLASLSPIDQQNLMSEHLASHSSKFDDAKCQHSQIVTEQDLFAESSKSNGAKSRKLAKVESKIDDFFKLFTVLTDPIGKNDFKCPFDQSDQIGMAACLMHLTMCLMVNKFTITVEEIKLGKHGKDQDAEVPDKQMVVRFDSQHQAHGQKRVSVMFFKDVDSQSKQSKLCLDIESILFHSTYNRLVCRLPSGAKINPNEDVDDRKKNLDEMGDSFTSTVKAVLRMYFENSYELTLDHVFNFFRIFASQTKLNNLKNENKKEESNENSAHNDSHSHAPEFHFPDFAKNSIDSLVLIPTLWQTENLVEFSMPLSEEGCLEMTGRIEFATESFIKLTMESGSQNMQLLISRYTNHEVWLGKYKDIIEEIEEFAISGKADSGDNPQQKTEEPKNTSAKISAKINSILNAIKTDELPRYEFLKSSILKNLFAFIDIAKANQSNGINLKCVQPMTVDDVKSIFSCVNSGFEDTERKNLQIGEQQSANTNTEAKIDLDFIDFSFVVGLFEHTLMSETFTNDEVNGIITFAKIYHGEEDLMVDPYLVAIHRPAKKNANKNNRDEHAGVQEISISNDNDLSEETSTEERLKRATKDSKAVIRNWDRRSESRNNGLSKNAQTDFNDDIISKIKWTLQELGDESDFRIAENERPDWLNLNIEVEKMVADTILEVRKHIKGERFANDRPFSNFIKLEYGIHELSKSFEVYIFEQNLEIYKSIHVVFKTSLFSHEFILPRLTIDKMKSLFKLILTKMADHYYAVAGSGANKEEKTYNNLVDIQAALKNCIEPSDKICIFDSEDTNKIAYFWKVIKPARRLKLIDLQQSFSPRISLPGILFEGLRDSQCLLDRSLHSNHHIRRLTISPNAEQKVIQRCSFEGDESDWPKPNLFITNVDDSRDPFMLSFSDTIKIDGSDEYVPIHASIYIANKYSFNHERVIKKFLDQIRKGLLAKSRK